MTAEEIREKIEELEKQLIEVETIGLPSPKTEPSEEIVAQAKELNPNDDIFISCVSRRRSVRKPYPPFSFGL